MSFHPRMIGTSFTSLPEELCPVAACRHVFSFTHKNLQRNKNDCFVLLPYCTAPLVFWTSKRLKEVEFWPFRGFWGVWRSVKCDIPYTISLNLWEEQKNSRGANCQRDLKFGQLPSKSLKAWPFGYKSTSKKSLGVDQTNVDNMSRVWLESDRFSGFHATRNVPILREMTGWSSNFFLHVLLW